MGIDGVTNITVIRSRESFFWILPLMLTSPHLSPGPRQVPLTSNIFKRRSFLEVWQLASASGLDKKKLMSTKNAKEISIRRQTCQKFFDLPLTKGLPLLFPGMSLKKSSVGRAFFGSAHYQP